MVPFLKQAAHVCPSQKQLDWYAMEMYAFVHFSPNTFTDLEWGDGTEPEAVFNPTRLDCDQWVEAIKSAGLKGMVLTAKHHDGFCLWPSKYTEHSVKNCPVPRDIVKEASLACKRGGIKFGIYLSPWDRNSKYYGTPEYNDYFCNQLTELLTQYGEIFYVWFDNACGEGPNGKKQQYDFPRYFALIHKYQPNALIFNDFGPDVRWCGNENESQLSALESRLARYLTVSAQSARNLRQQKDQISTLVSDISHQTKTPVANLRLYAQLLEEQPLTAQGQDCVQAISSQAEKLQALIEALVKCSCAIK